MASEWETVALEDVADDITVGHVGSMAAEYVDSGIPFLRSLNVEPFRVNEADIRFITPEFHAKLKKSSLSPGDVVIVRTGKPGATAIIPDWLEVANCSDLVIVRPGKKLDRRFLVYYMNSVAQQHISAHLVGAVQQHFNVGSARRIQMRLPPLREQQAIACILGTLDDKIELNRKRNHTLESMARAVFKSWFVDFDPVRAKAEGSTTAGLSKEIAALFPDAFEENELGDIPKGWRVGTVGNNFRLTMGQSPPGETYNETGEGIPFYQGRTDFGFRFPTRRVYCTAPTRIAEPGDTLVSVRAPVGDVNIAIERCAVGRGVAAIRHLRGSRSLTFHTMHNLATHFHAFEAEGTVFGSINKTDFTKLPFLESSDAILDAFERVIAPLDDQIEVLDRETITLAALRDALLLKLISGELRLSDAERIVGRAI